MKYFSLHSFFFVMLAVGLEQTVVCTAGENFITNPRRSDGFGAQFQTIIISAMYAELHNLNYVYTPFSKVEHNYNNDPSFVGKKEWLINFLDNFERNINNSVKQVTDYKFMIDYFESNLVKSVQSDVLKKIKTVFRANKNSDTWFDKRYFNIAIHVRRSNLHDIGLERTSISDDLLLKTIRKLRDQYAHKNPLFHFYSQGKQRWFKLYKARDVLFHLDESTEDTFISMVLADALVMAPSSFSYTAGILSNGTIYYIPFWHPPLPHWISVHNFLNECKR